MYMHNPAMVKYAFVWLEFNELNNTFMEGLCSNKEIQIADNWKISHLSGDKTSGYLGSGSSKDVIYIYIFCLLTGAIILPGSL